MKSTDTPNTSQRGDDSPAPESSMRLAKSDTAVVMIDPQNEVLSEKGLAWPLLHESLKENNTIENMERIFKSAKALGFEVFISPHYFYPTDKGWKFNDPLETDEAATNMFARKGPLNLDGFKGSGADWLERFKPYIEDGKPSWFPHTGSGVQRPTTSFCNSANGISARSFWGECSPTCAWNRTCASCWSRDSR
jgi:hypothetical protein